MSNDAINERLIDTDGEPVIGEDAAPNAETEKPYIEIIDEPKEPSMEERLAIEKDKYLRLYAEFENFRRRAKSEKEAIYADAKADAVKAFLDVYDALSLALKTETSDAAYKQGVELIMRKMTDILDRLGVSAIIAEPGAVFDPEQHNAIAHIEDDRFEAGVVAEELIKGFKMKDRVIRHSMVKAAN